MLGGVFYYLLRLIFDENYHFGDKLLTNNTEYSTMVLFVFSTALFTNLAAPYFLKKRRKTTLTIGRNLEGVSPRLILSGTVGIVAGFTIALLLSMTYRSIVPRAGYAVITTFMYAICGFIGYSIAIAKDKEVELGEGWSFLEKVYSGRKERPGIPKILDTSAIIDGRIIDVIRVGFIEEPIVVPEFVVKELQQLADSSDDMKRAKGRRGLDLLSELEQEIRVIIMNESDVKGIDEIPEVDVKLVKLAGKLVGRLITTDYNLNKVAKINGVKVMNINELANAIKPIVIPGEQMITAIIKQGKDPTQGIGYLDDGTMIVVEDGRGSIGKTETITVTSVIQTSAGKMIFGRINPKRTKKKNV